MPTRYKLLPTIFILLTITACRKEKSDVKPPGGHCLGNKTYSITHEGDLFVGNVITFNTDLPDCANATWKFEGHGIPVTYSNEKQLSITPDKAGVTYRISAIIDGDKTNSNERNLHYFFTPRLRYNASVVRKLSKKREWDVYQDSSTSRTYVYGKIDTFNRYKDTFAIKVIDDYTLEVKGYTFHANKDQVANGVVDLYSFSVDSPAPFSFNHISYFYLEDRVEYRYHPPQGGLPGIGKRAGVNFGVTTTYISGK